MRQDWALHPESDFYISRKPTYRCGTEANNATIDCQPSTPRGRATGTVRFPPKFGLSTELRPSSLKRFESWRFER